ncbi:MAG: hypothetical protein H8D45_13405 [Bacteroidetes bacterium]|nr:hypothetical protein [Bacteroidota bacterium]
MKSRNPLSLIIITAVVSIIVVVIILSTLSFEGDNSTLLTSDIKEVILPEIELSNVRTRDEIPVEQKIDNANVETVYRGAKNGATNVQQIKTEKNPPKRQVKKTKTEIVKATQSTNQKVQDKVDTFFKNRKIKFSNLPDDVKLVKVDTVTMITSRTVSRIENFLKNRN